MKPLETERAAQNQQLRFAHAAEIPGVPQAPTANH